MDVGRIAGTGACGWMTWTSSARPPVSAAAPPTGWSGCRYTNDQGLSLTGRSLFDDDFAARKSEARMTWYGERFGISSGYLWGVSDLVVDRPDSHLGADVRRLVPAGGQLGRHAPVSAMISSSTAASSAAVGMEYRNECLLVDLYLSRRFTSSTSVDPTTEFTFAVDLLGFGGSATPGPARRCR